MEENNQASRLVREFYDNWADDYHLIFADWRESVKRQGRILGELIRSQSEAKAKTVLDCTCGIGTQAIGLALQGFQVTATDLSPNAVERAMREAEGFGTRLSGRAADVRRLDAAVSGTFDVVLTCDNSLCHLLDDKDLILAAKQMHARVAAGGLFLASIRDYDALKRSGGATTSMQQLPGDFKQSETELPRATIPRVFDEGQGRRVVFQVWDWTLDGKSYGVNQFSLTEKEGSWKTAHRASRFRALLSHELTGFLKIAGFREIIWHMPEESGFYQPIVTARPQSIGLGCG